jgi:hypothetical protein
MTLAGYQKPRIHGMAINMKSLLESKSMSRLGGGVIKQRVARSSGGKSGGFRTLILFRISSLAFFVHGFAKNEQANIDDDELVALRKLAAVMLEYDDAALNCALANKTLIEVICDEKTIP